MEGTMKESQNSNSNSNQQTLSFRRKDKMRHVVTVQELITAQLNSWRTVLTLFDTNKQITFHSSAATYFA